LGVNLVILFDEREIYVKKVNNHWLMTSSCSINCGTICLNEKQTHSLCSLYIFNLPVRPKQGPFQHSSLRTFFTSN